MMKLSHTRIKNLPLGKKISDGHGLSYLTETEKKALVKSLEDKNKDRRLYNSSTSRLSGKQKKFSTSWATASFQKALTKCKLPSNSRHLRKILKNN